MKKNSDFLYPPESEQELMQRCQSLVGLTLGQLAAKLSIDMPEDPRHAKGLAGAMIEQFLITSAGNQAAPDFLSLGIELKTLPIGPKGGPIESTFVTSIPLLTIQHQQWENSSCYLKLKRVLWVPVESIDTVHLMHRRVGQGFLWSPSEADYCVLRQDWLLLTSMIAMGQIEEINAKLGVYLQIRPKAANSASLCYAFGVNGEKIKTLPRGFYLRREYTEKIWYDKSC